MLINFVGNFQRSYLGEKADECHLADEMENLGHKVRRIPRDEWREHIKQGLDYINVPKDLKADINIIAKWHHFYDSIFAEKLREKSNAPVLYWVWDYMINEDGNLPDWHYKMILGSNLYLGNDVRNWSYLGNLLLNKKVYYFPFDVSNKQLDKQESEKKYDVVFFGSHFLKGDRVEWLKKINQVFPVKIFASNSEDWKKEEFNAEPAVYEQDFSQKVAETKIILGFNVNDHCWGYWSNRVGKVLTVGGFLLQRYVPGMELFLRDGVEYFSSSDEAIQKIAYYLEHEKERQQIADRGYKIGRDKFTSQARIKELMILIERYLKGAFLR